MQAPRDPVKIGLAITGSSGIVYGLRVLEELARRQTIVHLTISPNARHIARLEMGLDIDLDTGRIEGLDNQLYEWIIYHHHTMWGRPGFRIYGMKAVAVVPCNMGTLARIAADIEGLRGAWPMWP